MTPHLLLVSLQSSVAVQWIVHSGRLPHSWCSGQRSVSGGGWVGGRGLFQWLLAQDWWVGLSVTVGADG